MTFACFIRPTEKPVLKQGSRITVLSASFTVATADGAYGIEFKLGELSGTGAGEKYGYRRST